MSTTKPEFMPKCIKTIAWDWPTHFSSVETTTSMACYPQRQKERKKNASNNSKHLSRPCCYEAWLIEETFQQSLTMSCMLLMRKSLRMPCTAVYSRQSSGRPRARLASTVSSPFSWIVRRHNHTYITSSGCLDQHVTPVHWGSLQHLQTM